MLIVQFKYGSLTRGDERFGVAQFMRDCILLRDIADKNSGCYVERRYELHCKLPSNYVIFFFCFFLFCTLYTL